MEIKTSFWEPVIIKNELRLKHFALKLSKKGATNTIKKKKAIKNAEKEIEIGQLSLAVLWFTSQFGKVNFGVTPQSSIWYETKS